MSARQIDDDTPAFAAPLIGFRSRKAAQICAYFANRSGSVIDKLKLIKLVYLSERRFLAEHHIPMLFDEFYSLPHGPICSSTLNGLDGLIHKPLWEQFVHRDGRDKIYAVKSFTRPELDEISNAELRVLDELWREFAQYTAWQIRDYSHEHCPEYTEVTDGRVPISYREVLQAQGDDDAESVEEEVAEFRRVQNALGG